MRYPDSLGLKGAQAERQVSGEILRLNRRTAIDTIVLEYS